MATDLETRLASALRGAAGRGPRPGDLAAGARSRLRRRRRTAAAVVGACLVVVAVPLGLTLAGGGDGADRREGPSADRIPADWRTETWRDLTVRVPPGWTWGGGTDWCTAGRDPAGVTPAVSRPGGVVASVDCDPGTGYGAHFAEPASGPLPPGTEGVVQQYRGQRYPDGSWLGYATTRHSAVWIVAEDRLVARMVMDSVEAVGDVDANGCATRRSAPAPSAEDRVSVCRYGRDGWLRQSELLPRDASVTAAEAVASSPRAGQAVLYACPVAAGRRPVVTMRSVDLDVRLLAGRGCWTANVYEVDGVERQLTADVLFWALSPGWDGVLQRGLPAPVRFRSE
ncbi:hypothetical protein [Nocardioides coralli]|uniref:hypothetical protein n=1 Tax=Nocardioides coralli TaxID=2872154 RepID=UPI001CA3F5C2|nr:hypothetical protein [Nocardioides coralli]QZY28599.1 hypothetical protein K6T13_14185 [Nocardioides coralli]